MKDSISASITLKEDLHLISKWAYFWKMSFNLDPLKQATEIVFYKRQSNIQLPVLTFNDNILTPSDSHKNLGTILDSKRNFNNHLSEKISKANKGNGKIRRLYKCLPRVSLVNIYRAFVIAGVIHGSSRDKLYQKLCFDSLHDRRRCRKLCFYYKIQQIVHSI